MSYQKRTVLVKFEQVLEAVVDRCSSKYVWRHFLIKLQPGRLQWLLLTFNSYFQRNQERKLVQLLTINTRFNCKNVFNVAKVRTSVTEIIPGFSSFYFRILSFFNFAVTKWFCCNMFLLRYFYHIKNCFIT